MPVAAIVGAIMGVAVAGLVVLVGVVIACVLWRKKKKKRTISKQQLEQSTVLGNNPVYEGILDTQ